MAIKLDLNELSQKAELIVDLGMPLNESVKLDTNEVEFCNVM